MNIRKATRSDVEVLVAFNQAMAQETEGRQLNHETLTAGVTTLFDLPELGFYVVAERDREVLGALMVTYEWSDWRNGLFWWIQSVFVRPDSRRQGIYLNLYRWIRDEARAARHPSVCGFRLYVERDNETAQTVYRRMGMEETAYRMFEELT